MAIDDHNLAIAREVMKRRKGADSLLDDPEGLDSDETDAGGAPSLDADLEGLSEFDDMEPLGIDLPLDEMKAVDAEPNRIENILKRIKYSQMRPKKDPLDT